MLKEKPFLKTLSFLIYGFQLPYHKEQTTEYQSFNKFEGNK